MIGAVVAARGHDEFVAAVRALDRLLLSGFYIVPLFYAPDQWIAYSSALGRPEKTPLFGVALEVVVARRAVMRTQDAQNAALTPLSPAMRRVAQARRSVLGCGDCRPCKSLSRTSAAARRREAPSLTGSDGREETRARGRWRAGSAQRPNSVEPEFGALDPSAAGLRPARLVRS